MLKSFLVTFLLCLIIGQPLLFAQEDVRLTDSVPVRPQYRRAVNQDPAFLARQRFVTDSIMTHTWLVPDSLINRSIIIDSIIKANVFEKLDLDAWFKKYGHLKKKENRLRTGEPQPKGQGWVIAVIVVLLAFFGILRISFPKQLQSIIQAFYSNRGLNNLNKEDNVFSSWSFLFYFIQFGFTIGMFFYLVAQYYQLAYVNQGFRFFISVSVLVMVFYALKILFLRILGHLFNVQKAVHEYVSILYLSYFNISLLFIPLVVAFGLSPLQYGIYYIVLAFVITILIFTFQLIRAGVNILSHYRFPKFYLFVYFCALEICPILILIKAIGFEL
ncbi:DUF4271 domain-containing protein [Pedobacter antarcticus]|uniref:DUF4271 domain-containing protein n=2 Tax=Pedobacter antarcticus TaxID=34086 RepID=A0A081PDJ9_9SPHI|nr:DUF4271 domain-containing protein [Pedobacter antarcticus]KEQ28772.1 hypothetical protein N180_18260 [Pedobacter antarcticus 4BY]SDL99124.1 protein of unknown function [Pedobacter antarcticus]SFE80291.1 protein of unknown function [Pedobacter antarcticus]